MTDLCPFCGAYSTRSCELEDEENGVECPWLEVLEDENSALNAKIDDYVERGQFSRDSRTKGA